MKIGIVSNHSFPIPYKTHTGDIVILDLAKALERIGHDVTMYSPAGTDFHNVKEMRASFGLSQAEAMCCGTPVIGTKFGSVPEVVEDYLTGFVCDNNVSSIVSATKKISDLDNDSIVARGKQRFSINVMAANYVKLYEDIIEGKRW